MASCSLYQPVVNPLLIRTEMESILLFERVVGDCHLQKQQQSRLRRVGEFGVYLKANGIDTLFLETAVFKYDKDASIVCNTVGVNVGARKEASQWVEDVKNNKVEKFVPVETRTSLSDS